MKASITFNNCTPIQIALVSIRYHLSTTLSKLLYSFNSPKFGSWVKDH